MRLTKPAAAAALGTAAYLIAAQARLVPLAAWPRLVRLGSLAAYVAASGSKDAEPAR